jgi:hypothetical protein
VTIGSGLALLADPREGRDLRLVQATRSCWLAVFLLALAVLAQCLRDTPADVSWLITLCEKTLAGETPYVDFIEVNPPAAFLIYMPGTWSEHFLGVSPEFMVALSAFLAAIASLGLCLSIFRQAALTSQIGSTGLAIAVVVLTLLPATDFGQREHFALIFSLPLLATLTARASGGKVDEWTSVIAGLAAALMVSIKPYFALTFLAVLPYFARRVGLKAFLTSTELIALAFFALLGLVATVVFFPTYLSNIVPLVTDVYLLVRLPFLGLLLTHGFLSWIALSVFFLVSSRGRFGVPLNAVPALASVGEIIVFLIQGKGWSNHAYPAIALMGLAIGALVVQWASERRRAGAAVALVIAAGAAIFGNTVISQPPRDANPQLERLVANIAPHPKVLTISSHADLGFPLTRTVSGVWVGRLMYLWITASIEHITRKNAPDAATRARYERYLRFDREMLVGDIENNKPDAILIEDDKWKTWAFSHPDVVAALADFAPVGAVGAVTVYGRKLGLRPSQENQ